MPRTVEFISGKTTEITWENTPEAGQIQITKLSADANQMNGLPAGTPLADAIFEVYDWKTGNIVDRFITGGDGRGVSKALPLGRYTVKEVQAPSFYTLNNESIDVTIEFATQIVKLEFTNSSANTGVTINKSGPYEVMANQEIVYEVKNVRNESTIPLGSFYWRDVLPTNVMRATKVMTGTFNQSLRYKVVGTTNKGNYIVIADNMSTTTNNVIGLTSVELGLAQDEYLVNFGFHFGQVNAGFTMVESAKVYGMMLNNGLPNGTQFANRVDVGGTTGNEWVVGNSTWVTTIFRYTNSTLPKTGW